MMRLVFSLFFFFTVSFELLNALDCKALTPSSDPQQNFDQINTCLVSQGTAILTSGTFPVVQGLEVPAGATLRGNNTETTILLQTSKTNFLVLPGDNARIEFLNLDANNKLPSGCCSSIVSIVHSNAVISNNVIQNGVDPKAVGVYFLSKISSGNVVSNNQIRNTYYGVIFIDGLDRDHVNILDGNWIYQVECDSVTLAGYGKVTNNRIFHNGWGCANGNPPIPGGAIYCLKNIVGAEVAGNDIHDNCGLSFDIDECANFVVYDNYFHDPFYNWNGRYPYCCGPTAVVLMDTSNFQFRNNHVENTRVPPENCPWGDSNHVYSNVGAPPFSDLPAGVRSIVGFAIAKRPNANNALSINSSITNNALIANCNGNCLGVGYFESRNTGYDANRKWSPNFFEGNVPFGSNVGSKRCGGNWYAGNSQCEAGSPPPCNADDYQHDRFPFRNDGCDFYDSFLL